MERIKLEVAEKNGIVKSKVAAENGVKNQNQKKRIKPEYGNQHQIMEVKSLKKAMCAAILIQLTSMSSHFDRESFLDLVSWNCTVRYNQGPNSYIFVLNGR